MKQHVVIHKRDASKEPQELPGEKITLGSQMKEDFFLEEVAFELHLKMAESTENLVGGRGRAFRRWFTPRPQRQESTKSSKKKVNNSGWPVEGVHEGMVCGRGEKGTRHVMEDLEHPTRNGSKHRGTMEPSKQGERENDLGPCALRITA